VVPAFLLGHLHDHHCKRLNPQERLEYAGRFAALPIQDPRDVARIQLPLHAPPIPYLALYDDGICCTLCTSERPYVCRNERVMLNHLGSAHQWKRKRGWQGRCSPQQQQGALKKLTQVTYSPIACQTFHRNNYTRYFPVDTGAQLPSAATIAAVGAAAAAAATAKSGQPIPTPLRESLRDRVKKQLAQKQEAIRAAQAAEDARTRQATEVSR
jgi:hypothetical protein